MGRSEMSTGEEALRSRDSYLSNIYDCMIDGLVVVSEEDGHIRIVNGALCTMLGFKEEELIGQPFGNIFAEEEEEEEEELKFKGTALHTLLRKGFIRNVEKTCLAKDGVRIPVLFSGSIIRDDHGGIDGIVCVVLDIIDRKRAEKDLQQSEEKFRSLVEGSIQGICVHCNFKPLFVNRAYAAMHGFEEPREVLALDTIDFLFAPHERQRLTEYKNAWMNGGVAPTQYEYQGVRRDGTVHWMESLCTIVNWDGSPAILDTVIDITDRKKAEEERSLLAVAFEQAGDCIFVTDAQGAIQYVNPAFKRITGYSRGEAIGQNPRLLKSGKTDASLYEKLWDTLMRGAVWKGRYTNKRKDGTYYDVEVTNSPIRNSLGEITHFVSVQKDVTQQAQLEEQLRESQKMEAVGQLAGGIAHQFNNMLQIIINGVYFARDNFHEPQLAKQYLGTVLKSAARSAELTKQLLAYSRKTTLMPTTLNLNDLTTNLMKMVRPIIGEDVVLEFKQADELFPVKADANLLEQTLVNLCVNARDAMPDGGRLVFETRNHHADQEFCDIHGWRQPGDYAMISVSDNGVGMTSEIREHIFEPFFTTKEVGKGTGLGLAMVHGIVQQHDGMVEALSEPGVGSTFNIYLPKADSQETRIEQPSVSDTAWGNETVLVAEDEEDVLNMLSKTLESRGYRVLAAKDGEEAMSVFKANADRIDLVIMDMIMPKLRGRHVFEQIRESGSEVPVLFSTGYSLDSDDAEYVTEKGLRTIQKPYAPDVLHAAVREVLDRKS